MCSRGFRFAIAIALAAIAASCRAGPAAASTLPAGFTETAAFSGLTNPTAIRFAPTAASSSPRRAA